MLIFSPSSPSFLCSYPLTNILLTPFHCSASPRLCLPPQVTFIQYLSLPCSSDALIVLLFTLSGLSFLHPSISAWLLGAHFQQASLSISTTRKNSCPRVGKKLLPPHNAALVSELGLNSFGLKHKRRSEHHEHPKYPK